MGLEFERETRLDCSAGEQAAVLREVIAQELPRGRDSKPPKQAAADAAGKSGGAELRSGARHPLIWSGLLHYNFESHPVRLRNISSTGAMIECPVAIRVGAEPMLELGDGHPACRDRDLVGRRRCRPALLPGDSTLGAARPVPSRSRGVAVAAAELSRTPEQPRRWDDQWQHMSLARASPGAGRLLEALTPASARRPLPGPRRGCRRRCREGARSPGRRRRISASGWQADEQIEAAENSERPQRPARPGARNRRSRFGSRRRSTSIAAHTATKAARVPAFASAAIEVSGIRPAKTDVTIAVKIVIRTGVPRRETRARLFGSKPVAGNGEENPALAVEEREDHRRQGDHRRGSEHSRRPWLADLPQDQRQRLGAVGKAGVGDRADRRRADRHVDEQRRPAIEPTMPIARSRLGFLASSAAVAIASKP